MSDESELARAVLPRLDRAEIARSIEKLPALPPTTARLIAIVQSGQWHLDQVVSVVSLDPLLTGRALRLANSSAYAASGAIVSIRQAVSLLGIGAVTSMAVAVAVKSLTMDSLRAYNADAGLLWRHSIAALIAAEQIRAQCRWSPPDESSTAALLHDLGKLLLAPRLSTAAARFIARTALGGNGNTARAEEHLIGSSHAEIGAQIAEFWQLPDSIAAGIRHHHAFHLAPTEAGLSVGRAVAIADAVAKRLAPGLGEVEEQTPLERDAELLHLPLEALERLREATEQRLAGVLAAYA